MLLEKFRLDGKTALVTGASSGLGKAIAIALAEAGANVACHARSGGKAAETCNEIEKIGRQALEVTGDLAEKQAPAKIVDEASRQWGRVDIVVNNAGMIRRSPAVDFSEEEWSSVI